MSEINWALLGEPVDVGAHLQQGFVAGQALVHNIQAQNALKAYMTSPDEQHYSALAALNPEAASNIASAQYRRAQVEAAARETQLKQAQLERSQRLGGIAATDPHAAQTAALQSGDFDLAKTFGEMDETQQKHISDFYKVAAPLAYKLRQITDPEQRKQFFAANRGILASTQVDPSVIDQFDVTDNNALDGVISAGQTIEQLRSAGRVTWHQVGEFGQYAVDDMGRPVGSGNPFAAGGSGGPAAAPAAAAAPSPAAQGGFDAAVEHVLGNEGGFNASDMNGKPVNFGINQGANPDIDVKNLTRDKAKEIYRDRYWIPSGAQYLPANMQAPFFDVYIRNPSVAKRAWNESGGDPAKFSEITNGYFQHLGQSPEGAKYAKAWATRDGKNRGIATGVPHVASDADYENLPRGTEYIAPDGTHRRKA